MIFTIRNRWSMDVQFECEIPDGTEESMRFHAAIKVANLRGANLCDANLRDADLPEGCKIARLDFGGWPVTVTPDETAIGCQNHKNEDWLKWSPEDVAGMAAGASEWRARHCEAVRAVIRDVMSEDA